MANELTIPSGTKLQIAYDVPAGKEPEFNMICTFGRALDESAFLISIPMLGGKALPLDENQKMLIRYSQGEEATIIAAYADDLVKDGIRRFWKMRRVSELRQFIRRKDERLKVALRVEYTQPSWEPNEDGVITPETAMSMDVSAGGAALFLNSHYEVGEVLEIKLPRMGLDPEGAAIENIIAAVCWSREAPKGSPYRFISGLQFRMGDDAQREILHNYMAYLKKKYKL